MQNYSKYFFYFCLIFILILINWISHLTNKDIPKESLIEEGEDVKYILLYEYPKWMTTVSLIPSNKKCIVTTNRTYLQSIEMFDALLFNGQLSWKTETSFPKVRSPHQYYVFVDLECPLMSAHRFSRNPSKEIYNLTMTYRRDSDIYWPYGFISNHSIKYLSTASPPHWTDPVFNETDLKLLMERIQQKSKSAAWFVSNCSPHSKRDVLTKIIQQTIEVDIYGKCGTMVCPRNQEQRCYENIGEKYFFYFSFENSLCKDYVTEKVFNIMKYYIVPVVYGGANYSQYLPPHSYIDAYDFNTATELAQYLKYLQEHPKDYVKYFWWKKYYTTVVSGKLYNNLCDKLHEFTANNGEVFHKMIPNINDWWSVNACSNSAKIRLQ